MSCETLGASMLGNVSTGKGVMEVGGGYNSMDHMDKNSLVLLILLAIWRLLRMSIMNLGLMVFFPEII